MGLLLGLSIHTLIDGAAIAARVAHQEQIGWGGTWGIEVFLAVLMHKPLDALSIASLMAAGGWSARSRGAVILAFSLACPLAAIGFYSGMMQISSAQQYIVGASLGFSAGVFLCISLADLLPELSFHDHDRLKLSAALILGVALSCILL